MEGKKNAMNKPKFLSSRRFKHGTMATVITIVVVAVVVLVNVVAGLLLGLFPSSLDLTENNRFQLGEESIQYVQGLDEDITITVCMNESEFANTDSTGYYYQANQIIKQYAQYSGHITVQYVDLMEDPSFSANYPDYSLSEGDIIVESDQRLRVVDSSELVVAEYNDDYSSYEYFSDAEQVMTSAISYVAANELTNCAVITGHSESTSAGLTEMLNDNNYQMTDVDLASSTLDDSYDLVVICAPMVDYTDAELEQIDAFLTNGGNFGKTLLYIASFQQVGADETTGVVSSATPNLDAYLAEWGIEVSLDGMLYETDSSNIYPFQSGAGAYPFIGFDIVDEDRTAALRDSSLPVLGLYARPVNLLFEAQDNITTTALIQSHDTATLIPYNYSQGDAEYTDYMNNHVGTYNVAALAQKTRYDGLTPYSSNVLVLGDTSLLQQAVTQDARYNNNQYMVNLVNELTGQSGGINISAVSFTSETFTASNAAAVTTLVIFMILIPVAALGGGFAFWLVRRRK